MDIAKNFAKGVLSAGYGSAATSIVLVTGQGGRFPSTAFNAVWWNSTDYPDPSDDPDVEVIRVTARSTDTLTVTRGQEGTSAVAHNTAGKLYKLLSGLTAATLNGLVSATSWRIITSSYSASAGDKISANVTSAALTVTLPSSPTSGDSVRVQDGQGQSATHNITIARNGQSIAGSASDLTVSVNNADCELVFVGGAMGWQITRFQ